MLEQEIQQSNEENIKRNIDIVKRYSNVIHILVIFSKILIIISGLLSFSSTRFESIWILNFLSGTLNFLSTSLLSYSSFLTLERKKIVKTLNTKLQILGIKDKLLISENDSDKSS
jgi:cytochrome b subunit of formate dehydrogenase